MGAMGAMVLTTTTREFSVFPNILKKSPIAHVCDGRDGRDWRDGRYFQYPPTLTLTLTFITEFIRHEREI